MVMKKALLTLFTFAALAFAGFGSAQQFGLYMDYGSYGYKGLAMGFFGIGGYLPMGEKLRVGGSLEFASVGLDSAMGVGVRADYMSKRINLMDEPFVLDLYLSAQGNLAMFFFTETMLMQLGANGILGAEYIFPKANLGIFSELTIGPSFAFAGGESAFGFGVGGRFGINLY